MLFAAVQHQHFVRTLPAVDLPHPHNRAFPIIITLLRGLLGLALAIYLAV
jgi:hypothetical protein